ncbi:hypothetical protein DRW03_23620 [Corallococcus sp. H22C18031201]|uniref:toxin-antitoxin system YwqK family antitoxin n=1 Tax=Citreicoccus inhibens TaxID=2849499 RepID=UPI000E71B777|nr:hypothetical protein [Citreicoccus inhibens]MBU8897667.1 hypothetical protein [Citreicoccus inhibens]RJS19337.1 hypothetical protein DRW03_23620 [Corallococcus sp. H22C18031201]
MSFKTVVQVSLLVAGLWAGMAGAQAVDSGLQCPSGTTPSGSKAEGLFCRKHELRGGGMVAHGPYRSFHANGQAAAIGQYADGFKTGTWFFYDELGKEYSRTEFRENKYHGQRILFYPSGKRHFVEEYRDGVKNGVVQELSEDGRVVRESRFENGQLMQMK